ncbi:MAG: Mov34/MPN/PAD-1 family protein [Promethearchaeota archaeon]
MLIKEVLLSPTVYREIMHLLSENPKNEIVGLGFGTFENNQIRITNFVLMKNLDNSEITFSVDYEVLYKEIQIHEEKGEILVGIFHSHPKGASLYPSQRDQYFMCFWPYPYLWLIGSNRGEGSTPKLAIFTLLNEKIMEIPFLIMENVF